MTRPTSPIELTGSGAHLATEPVALPSGFAGRLAALTEVVTDPESLADASRDWWPLALHWALAGEVPQRAALIARPASTAEVSQVLAVCDQARVPVTPAGGRSGVCGASVPVFGGVLLDTTRLDRIGDVDEIAGVVEAEAGVFGPDLEQTLRADHDLTVGHFPQSFDISTVGGWVACRGAGQYSTRYGKIEDMLVGLEVALADGRIVRTGGAPAAATGPDLTQLFAGSEGTLGVITRAWLRAHPAPSHTAKAAYRFDNFDDGLDACRRIVRAGATPAVLRLYDAFESARGRGGDGTTCTLLVLDEGDPAIVTATSTVVNQAATRHGRPADAALVDEWLAHRNDTSALQALTRKGYVVDTMEIAAPWSRLSGIYSAATQSLTAVPHAVVASCHLSHSYVDGACLYFTFAATPPGDEIESTYVAMWDAGQRAVLATGGNLSHHHGIGLNRARFAADALGSSFAVLQDIKRTLDPNGILNPGKLGLASAFGDPAWP